MDDPMAMSDRTFRAHFGISKECTAALLAVAMAAEPTFKVEYLMWMFYFFKNYNPFDVCATAFSVAPNTFAKHLWNTIFLLRRLLNTVRDPQALPFFSYFFPPSADPVSTMCRPCVGHSSKHFIHKKTNTGKRLQRVANTTATVTPLQLHVCSDLTLQLNSQATRPLTAGSTAKKERRKKKRKKATNQNVKHSSYNQFSESVSHSTSLFCVSACILGSLGVPSSTTSPCLQHDP
jgi:hypothetical protein